MRSRIWSRGRLRTSSAAASSSPSGEVLRRDSMCAGSSLPRRGPGADFLAQSRRQHGTAAQGPDAFDDRCVSASTDSNNSGIIGQPPALTSSSTRNPPARGRDRIRPIAIAGRTAAHFCGADLSRATSQRRGCAPPSRFREPVPAMPSGASRMRSAPSPAVSRTWAPAPASARRTSGSRMAEAVAVPDETSAMARAGGGDEIRIGRAAAAVVRAPARRRPADRWIVGAAGRVRSPRRRRQCSNGRPCAAFDAQHATRLVAEIREMRRRMQEAEAHAIPWPALPCDAAAARRHARALRRARRVDRELPRRTAASRRHGRCRHG